MACMKRGTVAVLRAAEYEARRAASRRSGVCGVSEMRRQRSSAKIELRQRSGTPKERKIPRGQRTSGYPPLSHHLIIEPQERLSLDSMQPPPPLDSSAPLLLPCRSRCPVAPSETLQRILMSRASDKLIVCLRCERSTWSAAFQIEPRCGLGFAQISTELSARRRRDTGESGVGSRRGKALDCGLGASRAFVSQQLPSLGFACPPAEPEFSWSSSPTP